MSIQTAFYTYIDANLHTTINVTVISAIEINIFTFN